MRFDVLGFNMNHIKSFFSYIRGSDANLTLENSIFNITCSIGAIILFIMAIFNATIQMETLGIILPIIVAVCLLILYYFSRFEGKFITSALLSIPLIYFLTSIMWFVNGGQDGSIIHALQVFFLLFFAILPRKYHITFTIFHVISVATLYVLEYNYPEWVSPYKGSKEQMMDQVVSLTFAIICVYAIMMSIKAMYEEKIKEVAMQKENLESLNDMKDKMLSIISHDVRSPLAQLKSLLEVVTTSDIPTEQSNYLFAQIAKNVDETQNLLDTLVTWASLQVNGEDNFIREENIVLKEMVAKESALFSRQSSQKNLKLTCTIPVALQVFSDANILSLVIRNLLSNAIKFTYAGGEISLHAEKQAAFVVFSVKDTGVGISPERLDNLINSSKNISTRGTNKEKGSGLGLLLCKEFIEKSGGKLHIESELNKGTTFYVYIRSPF